MKAPAPAEAASTNHRAPTTSSSTSTSRTCSGSRHNWRGPLPRVAMSVLQTADHQDPPFAPNLSGCQIMLRGQTTHLNRCPRRSLQRRAIAGHRGTNVAEGVWMTSLSSHSKVDGGLHHYQRSPPSGSCVRLSSNFASFGDDVLMRETNHAHGCIRVIAVLIENETHRNLLRLAADMLLCRHTSCMCLILRRRTGGRRCTFTIMRPMSLSTTSTTFSFRFHFSLSSTILQ